MNSGKIFYMILILLLILLFSFIFLTLKHFHFFDSHLSDISLNQVDSTLHGNVYIPDKENIKSIKKYDDKFLEPEVRIRYENGIKLTITRLNLVNSYKFISNIALDKKNIVEKYTDNNEDVYCFRNTTGILYFFMGKADESRIIDLIHEIVREGQI